ncbi:hypothetical protein Ciccas_000077 [Cichlidogyrus casuarinus]|uniref:Uncharacterized protein n=1 Tax=Cichlidogyrus casuarinus TaxID=1844966 RepID=A0ABD2QP08_9PLAT
MNPSNQQEQCQNPLSIVTDDLSGAHEALATRAVEPAPQDDCSASNSSEEAPNNRSKSTPHTFPAQDDDEEVEGSSGSCPRTPQYNGSYHKDQGNTRRRAGFRTHRGGRTKNAWQTAASGKKESKTTRLHMGMQLPGKRHVAVNTTPTSQFTDAKDDLRPCTPGTAVCLNGTVWLETNAGQSSIDLRTCTLC